MRGFPADVPAAMIHRRVSEISRLTQARALLVQIRSPTKAARIAQQVIDLLNQEADERQRRPVAFAPDAKRGAARVEYRVEKTGLGENLAEYRPGSKAKPFRCPQPLYEAMVAVLAETTTSLTMTEIVDKLARGTGQKPGDHQYRPVMRLWMHVEPPLLTRSRSRYAPSDRQTFNTSSAELWNSLKTS